MEKAQGKRFWRWARIVRKELDRMSKQIKVVMSRT
jgi:hypothetical protein